MGLQLIKHLLQVKPIIQFVMLLPPGEIFGHVNSQKSHR